MANPLLLFFIHVSDGSEVDVKHLFLPIWITFSIISRQKDNVAKYAQFLTPLWNIEGLTDRFDALGGLKRKLVFKCFYAVAGGYSRWSDAELNASIIDSRGLITRAFSPSLFPELYATLVHHPPSIRNRISLRLRGNTLQPTQQR
ncbi:hypothetical protein BDK51DRAFT_27846 [Blyttiomyces helicus]|uniref:Uncharacterized protein n=1 Tax=Blyttiomyces helicus TaxID=388810 RepID=A0A4P9W978_9FUNG|nr:hypothetical protein BDK51DRAFT_27846 [Blyttiomyces helicus]|eukprot:RKO88033.1 hypothetical protein BDK51DRAFT_27846 [Blyttiomyces helicus]